MGASLPDFMLTYRAVEVGVFLICFGLVLNLFIYLGRNCRVCRILAPQPGIEPMLPTVEARSPNHWTTREVPPHETLDLQHGREWRPPGNLTKEGVTSPALSSFTPKLYRNPLASVGPEGAAAATVDGPFPVLPGRAPSLSFQESLMHLLLDQA